LPGKSTATIDTCASDAACSADNPANSQRAIASLTSGSSATLSRSGLPSRVLQVTGTVDLTGVVLQGTFATPNPTSEILLVIDNDGSDSVVGTFLNLPEGAEVLIGDIQATISYLGGDGNDVVLSVLSAAQVSGRIYRDVNNNLVNDDSSPLAGFTVFADANTNGLLDVGEISTLTDSAGQYLLSLVAPLAIDIRVQLPTGWVNGAPLSGLHTVQLVNGQSTTNLDFGLFRQGTVWDGGGTDNFWSTPENWAGDQLPEAGDILTFTGSSQTVSVNDLVPGMTFRQIRIEGDQFSLSGNGISLDSRRDVAIEVSGLNSTINLPITLVSAGILKTSSALTINGNIDLTERTLSLDADVGVPVTLAGAIDGFGAIRLTGPGAVTFTGVPKSYIGGTTVEQGELIVDALSSPGALLADLVVLDGGLFSLSGDRVLPNPLFLAGDVKLDGTIELAGTMRIQGSLNVELLETGSTVIVSGLITDDGGGYDLAFNFGNTNATVVISGSTDLSAKMIVRMPGTLRAAAPNALAATTTLRLESGATVVIDGFDLSVGGDRRYRQRGTQFRQPDRWSQ